MIVLAATNRIDIIDPALLRAGRFDIQLELPMPDEPARLAIFQVHSKGKPLAEDVDLRELARATEGLAGSDIEAMCRMASMLAIREFLNLGRSDADKLVISAKHFHEALEARKRAKE